ncbi:MAG: DNA polymerase III subunit delta [Rhodocyclaceae bacterium]|nr:DNA polymerase III subunit delta [Rhodocyclaceae bacterium]MBX3666980.1 DNA polymerase III subunit delta [Rhodocyclaceae bacterium]
MPRVSPAQFENRLAREFAPLYVLHGDEPLLVIEAADAVRARARAAGYGEREVLVAGGSFKWSSLTEAAANMSLFGGDKLIDLRIPTGKPGKEGGTALVAYCRRPVAGVVTLITLPELDWSTRKSAWFSALEEAGQMVEFSSPGLAELPAWIAGRLARQNQTATRDALEFIAAHVEGNLLAAHQEIVKLSLLHGPGEIDLAAVQDAVLDVARYDIEDFRSALLAGNAARLARLTAALRAEAVAAPLLLWIVANETRTLLQVRSALDAGRSADEAFKAARVFGARQSEYRAALARLSAPVLRLTLMHAARIDRIVKGVADGDLWDEFLQLGLRLAARAPARRA